MRQLRCLGVMETVHIRRLGFPIRVKFDSFLERFVKSSVLIANDAQFVILE